MRTSVLLFLFLVVVSTPGLALSEEDRGQAATCLALLHHQRVRCDGIAADLEEFWQDLGSEDPAGSEEKVRVLVLEKYPGDLAEARAAGSEARDLLTDLRTSARGDVTQALDRLWNLDTTVCDLVALPSAPKTRFAARLAELRRKIAIEEQALGRRLELESEELENRLAPYLSTLRIANVRAEGEMLDHRRENRPPPPPPPDPAAPLRGWHAAYQQKAAPSKAAFGRFIKARAANDGSGMAEACRTMSSELPPLLDFLARAKIQPAEIPSALKDAYMSLRILATRCTAGRQRETEDAFRTFQSRLDNAARVLRPWGLAP